MRHAKQGDRVQVLYQMKSDTGDVITDSDRAGPLEFIIGDEVFFRDLGSAIVGMRTGESRSVELLPESAFGAHRPELVRHVERCFFRTDQTLPVGTRLLFKSEKKETEFRVTAVDTHQVTLDANHPLAGQTLHFDVKLAMIY